MVISVGQRQADEFGTGVFDNQRLAFDLHELAGGDISACLQPFVGMTNNSVPTVSTSE